MREYIIRYSRDTYDSFNNEFTRLFLSDEQFKALEKFCGAVDDLDISQFEPCPEKKYGITCAHPEGKYHAGPHGVTWED